LSCFLYQHHHPSYSFQHLLREKMSSQLWSYRLALAAAFFGIMGMAMAEPIKDLSPRDSTPPVSNFPTLCSDMNTGSTPQSKMLPMLPQTLVNRMLTNSCYRQQHISIPWPLQRLLRSSGLCLCHHARRRMLVFQLRTRSNHKHFRLYPWMPRISSR